MLPGHRPLTVGPAYARQAAQSREPIALRRRQNVITLYPPGEVGGYSSFISVRDAPGEDRDLIQYDFGND